MSHVCRSLSHCGPGLSHGCHKDDKQTNKEENIKTTTQQIYKHTNKQIVDMSQAATVMTKIQYKSTDAKITTVNMSFCEYLLYSTHYLGLKF